MTDTLAFLGPRGTFGEQAALSYKPGAELVSEPANAAIVAAVAAGRAEEGIVPIENTLDGAIAETLDALIQHENVLFRHEVVLPVEQCLIARQGTRLADIEAVRSHPSALAQCRAFLEANLPRARLEAALSTAGAVTEAVAAPNLAAIGTSRAAELSGGEILARGVQDVKHNKTRFLVLGATDAAPTGDDKTSLAFTAAHDRPGSLIAVLRELADRGINLTRIESRPSREDLGIYIFLIDFHGHRSDPLVAEAITAVHERAHYFRLFGSYPRARD